jgi:hypothetical protein
MVLPIGALERDCDLRRVHGSFVIVEVVGLVGLGDRLGVFADAGMGFTPARNIGKRATVVRLGERWIHGGRFPE